MNELEKLRDKFFNECTDSIDGLPRVNMAPHDLLKWFEKQLTPPKSGKSEKPFRQASEFLEEMMLKHGGCKNNDLPEFRTSREYKIMIEMMEAFAKQKEPSDKNNVELNNRIVGTFCKKCRQIICQCKMINEQSAREFYKQKEPKEEYRLTDSDIVKKLENVHNRIATLPIEEKGLDEYFKIVNSLNEIKSNIKWFIHNEKHKQKEEPKPLTEWISVKDRLPELNKMVIMFSDKIETLALTEMEGCICVTDFYFYPILLSDSKVTHWMPLPNKPI